MDIDTSSWVVTVEPILALCIWKISSSCTWQNPDAPYVCCSHCGTPDQRPPEVQSFLDRAQPRISRVGAGVWGQQSGTDFTRPFTEVEEETYHQWVEVHDGSEGAPDPPAPKSILAARQAAPNSGCAGAAPRIKWPSRGRGWINFFPSNFPLFSHNR